MVEYDLFNELFNVHWVEGDRYNRIPELHARKSDFCLVGVLGLDHVGAVVHERLVSPGYIDARVLHGGQGRAIDFRNFFGSAHPSQSQPEIVAGLFHEFDCRSNRVQQRGVIRYPGVLDEHQLIGGDLDRFPDSIDVLEEVGFGLLSIEYDAFEDVVNLIAVIAA